MKAYLVHEYGENAQFELAEVEKPIAKMNHVIIEVKATSLNPVDHKLLTIERGINPELPAILHMDVAGVITEVGEGVTNYKVGDEVYGCAGGLQSKDGKLDGALADFMQADTCLIAHKPKSLSFAQAAALPLVAITAYEALVDRCHVSVGDNVLIHAGLGGVGHVAVQIARSLGAVVTTTVSTPEKAKKAKEFGAHNIVFYKDEAVEDYVNRLTHGKGFDVVFDTVGGDTLDKSFESARVSGQIAAVIGLNTHDLSPMHLKGLSLHLIFMLLPMITGEGRGRHAEILQEVAKLVDGGKLTPLLDSHQFTFAQAKEAHDLFKSGRHVGKIVLENR